MSKPSATTDAVESFRMRHGLVPADREAVRSIVERTGFFTPAEVDVAVELVDERLARGEASGYWFVFAEVADQVVGYACYGPIACTTSSYDLYWVAVDPGIQRQGLGRCLVGEVESLVRAAGGSRVYLDTSSRAQYTSTRAFYEANGYRLAARLEDFYAPGDDKVIYVKVLAESPVDARGSL
jgi:ribosomal protein S18 acetylase RimI-like enzyme